MIRDLLPYFGREVLTPEECAAARRLVVDLVEGALALLQRLQTQETDLDRRERNARLLSELSALHGRLVSM